MSNGKSRRIRCLIAKVGLDGHDRGAHVIARAFRDAGFEVIYSGLHNTPEEIATAAIQEDVDVLGISILSGAHNTLIPKLTEMLEEYGALHDTLVLVGGIIPEEDESVLYKNGVDDIFGPGESMAEMTEFVRTHALTQADTTPSIRQHCPNCGRFMSCIGLAGDSYVFECSTDNTRVSVPPNQ